MEKIVFSDLRRLIPARMPEFHKGNFGCLLSVCGSANYRGAAVLSSEAALRCGVGILRLASVEPVCQAVAARSPETTFIPLQSDETGAIQNIPPFVFERFSNITAVLCGCGLTVNNNTENLVRYIIENAQCDLVLDADALNIISKSPDLLKHKIRNAIITPHIGEFSRLCGVDTAQISASPEKFALEFAKDFNCVVVLKSYYTLIASPDGKIFISEAGNAGLARGGSGDLLAGMIASFLAQGLSPLDSAKLGTSLHGAAADLCADENGMTSMLPRDLIKYIQILIGK